MNMLPTWLLCFLAETEWTLNQRATEVELDQAQTSTNQTSWRVHIYKSFPHQCVVFGGLEHHTLMWKAFAKLVLYTSMPPRGIDANLSALVEEVHTVERACKNVRKTQALADISLQGWEKVCHNNLSAFIAALHLSYLSSPLCTLWLFNFHRPAGTKLLVQTGSYIFTISICLMRRHGVGSEVALSSEIQ